MGPGFVHLNCHSAYSLLEGALPVSRLVELALSDGMPAVGVTDTHNLFGALEFSETAAKAGLQPIIGCKVPIRFESRQDSAGETVRQSERGGQIAGLRGVGQIFLLSTCEAGYANLVRLITRFYLGGPSDGSGLEPGRMEPISPDHLEACGDGLIALTGGHDGALYPVLAEGDSQLGESRLALLKGLFGDRLYVSVERHDMAVERQAEAGVVGLAHSQSLPLVATNEPFFPSPSDFEAHDALLAIADGRLISQDDRRRLTPEHDFSSRDRMMSLFADVPEALENSVEIAVRCRSRPLTAAPILPRYQNLDAAGNPQPVDENAELRRQAEAGLSERLSTLGPAQGYTPDDYRDRLSEELAIIEGMNYPGYFLIVADFIKWAKARDIPVGPGRGSGAGSVVAWSLTITDLDPLRFGLLFERFLNPERVSMPDFDIDFCQERRDEVISYVQARYGEDRVAQIITFGTLQARAALRDVGRVLEMPYGQVDRLCKMVPADPANPVNLKDAVSGEPRFAEEVESDPVVGRLIDIATRLEGLYRHASTHAAGIVIGDRPLPDLVPLYRDPRSELPVTQFNMKWVEMAGLVKFDFLGLKTLTVMRRAVGLLALRGVQIDLAALPLDDEETYRMMAKGETVGVFQVESQGMRRALVGMGADRFEDIIALVALYRPGPMDNIPTYNRRKHGEEPAGVIHPSLEPVLRETYGVIIYQEQVMRIAQELSGYTLGEADILRRAMGKKIRSEMDAQRERFVEGAVERGVNRPDAIAIFDLVAKFASYGFNKSHAAAYALVAYQTAYLKANYPVEFLAASMSLEMNNTDKLHEFRLEARRLGIEVLGPDVNRSGCEFEVAEGQILYALAALKGVGSQVVDHIVSVRGEQPFTDIADFSARIDHRQINRKGLDCLIQAGAFDSLEPDRATLMAGVGRILAAVQERAQRTSQGVGDLFQAEGAPLELRLERAEPWSSPERLSREFAAVGAYLSAHPLDDYQPDIAAKGAMAWKEFTEKVRASNTEAGLLAATIVQKKERRTRTGGRIGILTLSDATGQYEALIYQERLNEWRDLLEPGQSLLFQVGADYDPETDDIRVRINAVEPLESAAERAVKEVRIFMDTPDSLNRLADRLDGNGGTKVVLVVRLNGSNPASRGADVEILLPGAYSVTPRVASAIKALPGIQHVEIARNTYSM